MNLLAGFHAGPLAQDCGLLAVSLVGRGVLPGRDQFGHLGTLLMGFELHQCPDMGEGDLNRLDGVLDDLWAIQQGSGVADRGDRAVVDDRNLVFIFAQGKVLAHLLGAPQRCIGREGFVLADDRVQSVLAFGGMRNAQIQDDGQRA